MKTKNKALLLALCAVMLVAASVLGTLAYLTYTTAPVVNTFTVGKVEITLDETDVDVYGVKDSETRVKTNEYKLIPGHTYVKDPTVTVKAGSEDCYVRVQVTVTNLDSLKDAFPADKYPDYYNGEVFLLQMLCGGWDSNTWIFKSVNGNVYEFWYKDVVAASATDTELDALFGTITVPGTVDEAALKLLDTVEINVVAHAIQADGFADADKAWKAWK